MLFEFGGPYNFYFIFVHWWVGCWVLLGRENIVIAIIRTKYLDR